MFSQLTALAKSATDFSLDNLQDKDNSNENNKGIEVLNPQALPSQENSKKDSSSNSSAATSVTSTFNQFFDYSFNSKVSTSTNSDKGNDVSKNDRMMSNEDQIVITPPADATSPTEKSRRNPQKTKPKPISVAAVNTSACDSDSTTDAKNNISAEVVGGNSPPKTKKGSGREAARQLEMQLRGTISDLESSLREKTDQLKHALLQSQRDAEAYDKLQEEMSSLRVTVSELEENTIDLSTQKEELEREVGALQRKSAPQKRAVQDLKPQLSGAVSSETKQQQAEEEQADRLHELVQELQQRLDAQTSKHAAQLSGVEKNGEAKVASSEQKAEALTTEVTDLKAKLAAQAEEMRASAALQASAGEREEQHRTRASQLEDEKSALQTLLAQGEEARRGLEATLAQLTGEKNNLEAASGRRLQEVMEETAGAATSKEEQLMELRDRCSDLQQQLEASESKHNLLKEKFTMFTEKTKVQVKKFIESQKVCDDERRQAAAALAAREAEVTSLRLKLENIDHSLSDRKAMSSELAERCSC